MKKNIFFYYSLECIRKRPLLNSRRTNAGILRRTESLNSLICNQNPRWTSARRQAPESPSVPLPFFQNTEELQAPMPGTLSALESKQTGKPGRLFRATLSKPQGQRRQRPLYRGARGDGTSPVPLALRGWGNGLLHTQNASLTELAQLPHYNQIIKSL